MATDTVTLYHAWSGDPAAAGDWFADVQEQGLRTKAQLEPDTADDPRNRYVYCYHPEMTPPQRYTGPAQRGFVDRPNVAVELPTTDVSVSELTPALKESRGYDSWQERWADNLLPYDDWVDEREARDYAAIEFVVPDGIPPEQVVDTYPDGLPDIAQPRPEQHLDVAGFLD